MLMQVSMDMVVLYVTLTFLTSCRVMPMHNLRSMSRHSETHVLDNWIGRKKQSAIYVGEWRCSIFRKIVKSNWRSDQFMIHYCKIIFQLRTLYHLFVTVAFIFGPRSPSQVFVKFYVIRHCNDKSRLKIKKMLVTDEKCSVLRLHSWKF